MLTNITWKSAGKLGAAGLLLALLTWGSWNAPNLHDYPTPVRVGMMQVAGVQPGPAAIDLRDQLLQLPGITACTISADARSLAYTYQPDDITPAAVQQTLAPAFQLQPYQISEVTATGSQCPVPAVYIVTLQRLRFAFNLRRLFVKV